MGVAVGGRGVAVMIRNSGGLVGPMAMPGTVTTWKATKPKPKVKTHPASNKPNINPKTNHCQPAFCRRRPIEPKSFVISKISP